MKKQLIDFDNINFKKRKSIREYCNNLNMLELKEEAIKLVNKFNKLEIQDKKNNINKFFEDFFKIYNFLDAKLFSKEGSCLHLGYFKNMNNVVAKCNTSTYVFVGDQDRDKNDLNKMVFYFKKDSQNILQIYIDCHARINKLKFSGGGDCLGAWESWDRHHDYYTFFEKDNFK